MTTSLAIDPEVQARIEAEATALPKGWSATGSTATPARVRYESRYARWKLRIEVFAMAGRRELAFEAVLLSDRPPFPARSDTLVVATVQPDRSSISRAFDLAWKAVAGRRDIEAAANRDYRHRRAAG